MINTILNVLTWINLPVSIFLLCMAYRLDNEWKKFKLFKKEAYALGYLEHQNIHFRLLGATEEQKIQIIEQENQRLLDMGYEGIIAWRKK